MHPIGDLGTLYTASAHGKGFFNHVDLYKTSLLQADIYQHLPAIPQSFLNCFGVGERGLEEIQE